jgi:hypothetical protein
MHDLIAPRLSDPIPLSLPTIPIFNYSNNVSSRIVIASRGGKTDHSRDGETEVGAFYQDRESSRKKRLVMGRGPFAVDRLYAGVWSLMWL